MDNTLKIRNNPENPAIIPPNIVTISKCKSEFNEYF